MLMVVVVGERVEGRVGGDVGGSGITDTNREAAAAKTTRDLHQRGICFLCKQFDDIDLPSKPNLCCITTQSILDSPGLYII